MSNHTHVSDARHWGEGVVPAVFMREVRRLDACHWMAPLQQSACLLLTRPPASTQVNKLIRSLAWSPDGTLLAAGGDEAQIEIYNFSAWRQTAAMCVAFLGQRHGAACAHHPSPVLTPPLGYAWQ
jgi:hypothetical protein